VTDDKAPDSDSEAAERPAKPPAHDVLRLKRTRRARQPDVPLDAASPPDAPENRARRTSRTTATPRPSEFHADSQAEIHYGARPGDRFARLPRATERTFVSGGDQGSIRATEVADTPRTAVGRVWRAFKRSLIGVPLASSRLAEERLSKVKALAIFSSDALSSTAYATEEILLILVLASAAGALTFSIPISIAIAALLVIVATSYRQTIRAYPNGGGAYKVAMDNLGELPGVIAGASLVVDYTLTVAVSTAAGVAAITSAVPELHDARVILAVVFVALLTIGNLRGLRESGSIFAIPTYIFLGSFSVMLVVGLVRVVLGDIHYVPHEQSFVPGGESITLFLILRAFSSGATALTGIEAISNGVPAFEEPSPKNAATTLTWMAAILTTLFVGVTILAHQIDVYPSESKTVIAQIADAVFNGGPLFYILQAATALILILAANTSFAGLPALASVMARERYLPRIFAFRGDRLGYSNGIMVLAVAAIALLVVYGAETHNLIPLYAVGVFIGFTLSQAGMVVHWRRSRERGWRRAMTINGVGAAATGVVAVIITLTKFTHGAWLTITAIGVLAMLFIQIARHYRNVEAQIDLPGDDVLIAVGVSPGQRVLIPVDELNRATLRAVSYALSFSRDVTALHVTDDLDDGEALRDAWRRRVLDVPLVIVESEFRSLLGPVLAYVDALDRANPRDIVTVVLPEYVARWPWQRMLHNQSSQKLKRALLDRERTVVVEIPYHLK
jgi:amino acid transporter